MGKIGIGTAPIYLHYLPNDDAFSLLTIADIKPILGPPAQYRYGSHRSLTDPVRLPSV